MSAAIHNFVPFSDVRIDDAFWRRRLAAIRTRTLPAIYEFLRATGRVDAFRLDWKPGESPEPHFFWDSDVAKWVEAACYSLAQHPDPALRRRVDETVDLILAAQQPDGYLNVYFTVVRPESRWTNLRDLHELYTAGHLIEAAVAHHALTKDRRFLDAACRFADLIGSVFGRQAGRKRGYCGHPEIELALVRLWRATGEKRYLQIARYFVDERGATPNYYDLEAAHERFEPWGPRTAYDYMQAHKPLRDQSEVGGHAVRAMYIYCAMADLAAECGDTALLRACRRLWDDLTLRKLYVTGGIGTSASNEGFTCAYDLPNRTAYAETCAAIGLVFWAQRMLRLARDARYGDVMEQALYNGVLSGVSLDGSRFFYGNPLASDGTYHRQSGFGCNCCPPNLARLLASLGGYVYSVAQGELAVHLYVSGSASIDLPAVGTLHLDVRTGYPWEGSLPPPPASAAVGWRAASDRERPRGNRRHPPRLCCRETGLAGWRHRGTETGDEGPEN
jgi:DUF1680 family protein